MVPRLCRQLLRFMLLAEDNGGQCWRESSISPQQTPLQASKWNKSTDIKLRWACRCMGRDAFVRYKGSNISLFTSTVINRTTYIYIYIYILVTSFDMGKWQYLTITVSIIDLAYINDQPNYDYRKIQHQYTDVTNGLNRPINKCCFLSCVSLIASALLNLSIATGLGNVY